MRTFASAVTGGCCSRLACHSADSRYSVFLKYYDRFIPRQKHVGEMTLVSTDRPAEIMTSWCESLWSGRVSLRDLPRGKIKARSVELVLRFMRRQFEKLARLGQFEKLARNLWNSNCLVFPKHVTNRLVESPSLSQYRHTYLHVPRYRMFTPLIFTRYGQSVCSKFQAEWRQTMYRSTVLLLRSFFKKFNMVKMYRKYVIPRWPNPSTFW